MKRYFPRKKLECPLMTKNTSIPAQISYQKSAKNCINFNLLLFPFYTHWFPYLYFEILDIKKTRLFVYISSNNIHTEQATIGSVTVTVWVTVTTVMELSKSSLMMVKLSSEESNSLKKEGGKVFSMGKTLLGRMES